MDPAPTVPVWPDNRQAVEVFLAMRTQWRVGAGGPIGLDYGVLPEIWRRLRVAPGADRDQVFAALQFLETGALEAMREPR